MRKELAMIAFPQAAIKMTIIEDGVGISDNMCWYPELGPCVTGAVNSVPGIKKIICMGPRAYIRGLEPILKKASGLPVELVSM